MRRPLAILLVCALGPLAGCGNSRTPVPSLTASAAPSGLRELSYPAAGVKFSAPRNWTVIKESSPLVAVVTSGDAVVAVWRYPRFEPAPRTAKRLAAARRSLIAAARARQRTIDVIGAHVLRVDGAPAIELDALERVNGQLRRSRSTHVFIDQAEVVLDEYAPPNLFPRVDQLVFAPLERSLLISSVT